MMDKSCFYITTPIYYVNDAPHIGHAYTTILADILAREHRLCGIDTFFLTGTDEHGQKVEQAAKKALLTPQQQADQMVVHFQKLWKELEISHNKFIRTTNEQHKITVQRILQKLYNENQIYKAEYDGWYCISCEQFYTQKDITEGKCIECGKELQRITESNYFFKMSSYQKWLIDYIQQHPKFIQPDFRRNETLGFLQKPLNDLCISRPKKRLNWGIDLPFDKDFVTYVWFDALINYISAIGYGSDEKQFQKWWPPSCQLIGKDILTTHSVYWPTILKAINLPIPETIFAHGWWLTGKNKMSKSTGNVIDPMKLISHYGADPFRYFLIAEMTLGQDCNFSEESFIKRYNADLANDLGNLLNRVMKLIITHCDGKVPQAGVPVFETADEEEALRKTVLNAAEAMEKRIKSQQIDPGVFTVRQVIRETNRYLEQRQPWSLSHEEDKGPLSTILYHGVEALRIISGLLYPIMPEKMGLLRKTLGLHSGRPAMHELRTWGKLKPGTRMGDMITLFPRIR